MNKTPVLRTIHTVEEEEERDILKETQCMEISEPPDETAAGQTVCHYL